MSVHTSAAVDSFTARLAKELEALSWNDRSELLLRIGRQEQKMQANPFYERPVWRGPLPVMNILGTEVVVPTEQGERRGRVICFGIVDTGSEFEKSVIVHVPASGTSHEVAGSLARLASPDDLDRMQNEIEMSHRLAEVSAQHSNEIAPRKQRSRGQRDPKLIEEFLVMASASSNVCSMDAGSSNHKVTGWDGSKRLYVFKNQLRVDLSGFSFDHPGVRRISEDEARDMHLGKVRGQLLFDDRQTALSAFAQALQEL